MTSVTQVLRRSKCYETFCCSIRPRERGDTGARQQVGGEKTQLNVGGSVGGTQFDCFFIAIILVPSLAPGNGDLTRHDILVDLYRVFLQLQISRYTSRVNEVISPRQSDFFISSLKENKNYSFNSGSTENDILFPAI